MPNVSGVELETNAKGQITYARFNLKKHGDAIMPILKDLGAVEKTEFQKEWEKAISVDECFDRVLKIVEEKWPK